MWQRHGWRIALLWIILLAAYSNSFQAGLVFDNAPIISEDPRIRQDTPQNVKSIFTGQYWFNNTTSGLYRPLTTLSYLANYAVLGNGIRPEGYHWINLAIHAANVALVYALGILIFGDPLLALSLAAIWGLHPLLTESVTNIVGRADLLAGFGVLAGLLCYVRATSSIASTAWIAALASAQAIGVFSKESGAILPAIMLLYDLAWPDRTTWRRRAIAYGALLLPLAAFFYLRAESHAHLLVNFSENPLIAAGFWTARLTAVKVIGKFLWLFIWPASLSADYSYHAIPIFGSGLWEDAKSIVSLVICAGAILIAFRFRSKHRALFFFALFFFVALAPTANLALIIGSIMAERFVYLASVGLAGCVVIALTKLTSNRRTILISNALICVVLGARTYVRNFDWYDGVSLWSSAIRVSPQAARSHNNLAYAFMRMPDRIPDAIAEYDTAVRIRPDYPEALFNLGNALHDTGRLADAIARYWEAARLAPGYVEVHNNLANVLVETGQINDAIAEFHSAMRLRPDYAEAHNNLGNALLRVPGRAQEAIAECQTALRLRPDYAEAHNNLGMALMQTPGRLPQAIAEFQAAIRVKPDYAEAHSNLGSAFLQFGRLGEAIAQFKEATRIQPTLADAHYNLGNALLQVPGRAPEAIAEFEAVLRIHPDPEAQLILQRLRSGRR